MLYEAARVELTYHLFSALLRGMRRITSPKFFGVHRFACKLKVHCGKSAQRGQF